MKRFICKSLLVIAIISAGLLIGEISLRHLPNDYSYKAEWMSNNVHSVEAIVMGASDGNYGINPDYLSMNAFNLCFVSQTIDYTEFMFNKYYNSFDSLKYLILTVSYPYPFSPGLAHIEESWRCKNYNIYFDDTKGRWDPSFNFILLNFKGIITWKNLIKSWTGGDIIDVSKKGFGTGYKTSSIKWKSQNSQWVSMHSVDCTDNNNQYYYKKNQECLDRIIKKCNIKGIRVVLVTLPVYEGYFYNLPKDMINLHHEFCQSAAKKNNVTWLDYSLDKDFVDQDFFNSCHLSYNGAEKMSKKLNEWFKDNNY